MENISITFVAKSVGYRQRIPVRYALMILIRRSSYEYPSEISLLKKREHTELQCYSSEPMLQNKPVPQKLKSSHPMLHRLEFPNLADRLRTFEHKSNQPDSNTDKSVEKKLISYLKRKKIQSCKLPSSRHFLGFKMSQTPTFFSKKTNEFSKRFPKFKRCNLFKTSREAKNFFCFLTTTKGPDLFTWPI